MSDPIETKTQPAPFVPPSQVSPAELMKAFQEDGVIEAPAETEKSVAETKAAPPPAPAKTEDLPALVRIAREKDALRKEREQVEPHLGLLKQFSPVEAQRLAAARAAGDPVAALRAMGFDHETYTKALLNMKDEPKEAPKTEGNSELDNIRQELAALKAEREVEKVNAGRTQVLSKMREVLQASPKFEHINKLEEYESVNQILVNHYKEYGSLPGDTIEESFTLAAEVREAQLRKEAERWSKVLTGFKEGASTSPQKAPESPPSTGTVPTRTLTNANTSAPAAVRTVPKSRAELLAAIAEGRDDALE